MFQAQDGFIQFVFANEDTYFTDSGLRLSLRRWLYRELSATYQYVFFIQELAKNFSIVVFDPDSWNMASGVAKKLPFPIKAGAAFTPSRDGCAVPGSADTVLKLLKHAGRAAFVFRIAAFQRALPGNEALLLQLRQDNAGAKNLLLIQAEIQAEYNRPLFRSEDSIFLSRTDRGYLFPEVVQAFLEPDEFHEGCYRKLKGLLGECCIFLNRFTIESVTRVVWNAAWHTDSALLKLREKTVDEVSDFVLMWYKSDAVQARWAGLMHTNDRREFGRLYSDLTKRWDQITEAAAEYREWKASEGTPAMDADGDGCVNETLLVRRLKEILPYHSLNAERDRKKKEMQIRMELQKACRMLMVERTFQPGGELQNLLLRVIVRMGNAARRGDLRTIQYGGECLRYACEKDYRMEGGGAACLSGYDLLTQISESVFLAETGSRMTEQNLQRIQSEFSGLMGELEGGVSDLGAFLYQKKVDLAERLQAKVEVTKGKVRSDAEKINVLNQMLFNLETMIREVAQIREYHGNTEEIIRDLSAQLGKSPEQRLRDLMNSWI